MLLEKVIDSRGLDKEDRVFYDPSFYLFHDPFLMKGIAEAVKRVAEAKEKKEKVTAFGDYDCDGVTGTTVLVEGLGNAGVEVNYIIPSRLLDGYGLSTRLIEKAANEGTKLLITVDTGISGKSQVEFAKSLGMDVIVLDHHLPDIENMPDCIIANPKQSGCMYPFKELSGCAVAFKFITAFYIAQGIDKAKLADLMDMVTLSTIADVVPLVGENRSIVKYGLKRLKAGRMRPGLQHLIINAEMENMKLSSTSIGFKVVPQVNAIGRIGTAERAVKLMLLKDLEETKVLANTLKASNTSRQEIQQSQLEEAISKIEEGAPVNLIYLDYAHEGVIGIIAGRVRELTHRPTFIFTMGEAGYIKASARSVESIHLYDEVIYSGADLVCKSFGGHGGSCGLTVEEENFEELKRRLTEGFSKFSAEDFERTNYPVLDVAVTAITTKEIESLNVLEPYGKDNPKPVFRVCTDGLAEFNVIGKNKDTAKIVFDYGSQLVGMIFKSDEQSLKEYFSDRTATYWFEGQLDINVFREKQTPQMIISKYWREDNETF